ncbi:MAG: DMT family transporter [Vulcanimicrobiaceae bacterium]
MQNARHRRADAPLFLIVAAYAGIVGIWGTTWLGIKFSLLGWPPLTGAGARFLIAGAVLWCVAFARGIHLRPAALDWRFVAILAFSMFGLSYALTYLAETHLASGLVAVLYGTMPFFVFAFALPMLGERTPLTAVAGAVLALAGVAVISLVGAVRGELAFIVAALVASASSAFGNVYLKRHASVAPLVALPPAMLLGGAGLTLCGLATERTSLHAALAFTPLAALLYLALVGSALAFVLNAWLLQRIPAGAVSFSALMVPVIAVAVGIVFGGEVFSSRDLIGAALVIAGAALALRAPAQRSPTVEAAA